MAWGAFPTRAGRGSSGWDCAIRKGCLALLKEAVERMLLPWGWEREERPFRPHLTLGRVRERTVPPTGDWMRQPPDRSFEVEALHLMESRLQPAGAKYVTVHSAPLGG